MSFDPYHKWLGIAPKDQPPNHYRLLGIDVFESDADVIDAAANKQMAYVQSCATGPHLAMSQKILNEIAAARLCLLDPKKKAIYDAELRTKHPVAQATEPALEFGEPKKDEALSRTKFGQRQIPAKTIPRWLYAAVILVPTLGVVLVATMLLGSSKEPSKDEQRVVLNPGPTKTASPSGKTAPTRPVRSTSSATVSDLPTRPTEAKPQPDVGTKLTESPVVTKTKPTETPTKPPEPSPPPRSVRLPVPDAAALAKADKEIKELYKAEYGKTDKQTLALKFLIQAGQSKDDAAARFVLLREARDLAVQAREYGSAWRVIQEMDQGYVILPLDMKVAILEAEAKAEVVLTHGRAVAEASLALVGEALNADDFASATRLLKVAEATAAKTENPQLQERVQARRKAVDVLRQDYERVQAARSRLQTQPDDGEANLVVGKYLCLHKGQWSEGLPLLIKGSDAVLQELARNDFAGPSEFVAQVEVADGWWDQAEQATEGARTQALLRAKLWYGKATNLSGVSQAKVEKRRKDLAKIVPPAPAPNVFTIANSIGMKLVYIPAGEFTPKPDQRVKITKSNLMGMYEVTVGQFRAFVSAAKYKTDAERSLEGGEGANLKTRQMERSAKYNWQNPGFPQTDDHPVVNVSWNDATEFCRWLSNKEGAKYRLPTEGEWEHACRAGTATTFSFGNSIDELPTFANVGDASLKATGLVAPWSGGWADWDDGYPFTAPVGKYRPNPFGLCDMHGNAYEWCQDWFDSQGFGNVSVLTDPAGPTTGNQRSYRSGSWIDTPPGVHSGVRYGRPPTDRSYCLGFRVVRAVEPSQESIQKAHDEVAHYLSDLKEMNVKVQEGGFNKGRIWTPIVVKGVESPHGLFTHPRAKDYASVSYQLDRNYRRFKAEAAIAKQRADQGNPITPLTFEVTGDGKSLWKSQPLKQMDQSEGCTVKIDGVRVLELRVHCPGPNNWAYTVWLEPRLFLNDE